MVIHKCKKCVWSDKINSNLLYCILPRCIEKEVSLGQVISAKNTAAIPKAKTTFDKKSIKQKRCGSK